MGRLVQKNRRWMRNLWLLCMAAWLCAASVSTVYASENNENPGERRTVRVAFPSQDSMSEVGESGDLGGYNYEYLQELAEYAGWELEYVTFDDLSADEGIMKAMEMVVSGEADLLGPMLKNDAVEEMFDFPEDNYGVVYTTLCALEKSSITSVSYSKLSPLRVAVFANAATRNQEVSSYLDQQKIEYELIPCETAQEQLTLLTEGKADVLSSITLSYFDGTRSVAQFAPRPYYLVTTKGNTELLEELDAATAALNYTRPYMQQQLQEEYFGDTSSGYVLTDAELEYIQGLNKLNILCASRTDAPYVLTDASGEPAGMLISLLNKFAEINNLDISYTFCESIDAAEKMWQTGRYDCLIGSPLSSEYSSENNLVRSESITSIDLVLFARQQTTKALSDSTIAVYSRLADQIKKNKFKEVLLYDDPEECYQAVEKGTADYGCADRLSAEYILFERNSSLMTIPLVGEQEEICIGVSRNMSDEFLSALNKYIHTLPDSTKTAFISEGSRHTSAGTLALLVKQHPIGSALTLSAAVVLIISLILFAFYASRSKQKNLELQKANSAKSDFLARMSHDIRTPMNAIVGYLGIAKDTEGCPEKVTHCIENSETAAKLLLQLINDILDMSSIESGKMKIAREEFDLKQEIVDATAIFYQTSKAKGVHFETHIKGITREWVVGDQLRMNQIVMNLLSNAVKFTPEGGTVRLWIEQLKEDESGSDIRITVSDTGIGMSEEYMERLFQPFEQESADTARQYGGSGLGLSIAHSLVTMMDGTITVKSQPDEGTTFTVLMHFGRAVKNQMPEDAMPEDTRVRILLVCGDADKAENIKGEFEAMGVSTDIVNNGAYAVKRIHRRRASDYPYNLCILDWNTLYEDCTEVAAAIKAEIAGGDFTLVATGYDMSEFQEEARAAGVDSFAASPLFPSDLREIVRASQESAGFTITQKSRPVRFDLSGKRALLAEDNAMNMEIAVTVLTKAGIVIDQAADGQQAAALFQATPPGTYDFILMDIQMPVMDGYEATRAIRALKRPDAGTIPIIAMTANAFAEDVNTAMESGMNAHIAKPVNYGKLFAVLEELL